MHWNYRVVYDPDDDGEPLYHLAEVSYDEHDNLIGWTNPFMRDETETGLRSVYDRMREAFDQPVLFPADFANSAYNPWRKSEHAY
jgi:hypothetical protein